MKINSLKITKSYTIVSLHISLGVDTFPSNAPAILDRGKGVYTIEKQKIFRLWDGFKICKIPICRKKINQSAIQAIVHTTI